MFRQHGRRAVRAGLVPARCFLPWFGMMSRAPADLFRCNLRITAKRRNGFDPSPWEARAVFLGFVRAGSARFVFQILRPFHFFWGTWKAATSKNGSCATTKAASLHNETCATGGNARRQADSRHPYADGRIPVRRRNESWTTANLPVSSPTPSSQD